VSCARWRMPTGRSTLEDLVAPAHPVIIADALAGVPFWYARAIVGPGVIQELYPNNKHKDREEQRWGTKNRMAAQMGSTKTS
jgi:hypothetical protein